MQYFLGLREYTYQDVFDRSLFTTLAVVIKDTVYFMASGRAPVKIYKTSSPKTGKWAVANSAFPIGMTDPDLFLDNDGRLYFYYGCSNVNPIYAVELELKTLNPKGEPVVCFNSNKEDYGWEQRGDYNNWTDNPWIEGSWMTRHNDKYYLQYATPGTEYKCYADGLYIADNPLGPFKLASHNPCSYKPEGFIAGAGHSSTFKDRYGNYWHISTMTISVKHSIERRLGLFPMFFDNDGILYTYTGFGDFPYTIPQKKISSPDELFPQWMLLSYNKPVEVSSALTDHPKAHAVDEEIRTFWSAQTGNNGEWISLDLQKQCTVNAVQINYAENATQLHGRSNKIFYQYLLEYSEDNKIWKSMADKTLNNTDVPHDYIQLSVPVTALFIRLINYHVPDGTFALADIRIFVNGQGSQPKKVESLQVLRNPNDKREVKLKWNEDSNVVGFNIRYGTQADKLYHNYQVLYADSLTIRSLNRLQKYYFTVDVFNETGVVKGTGVKVAE